MAHQPDNHPHSQQPQHPPELRDDDPYAELLEDILYWSAVLLGAMAGIGVLAAVLGYAAARLGW